MYENEECTPVVWPGIQRDNSQRSDVDVADDDCITSIKQQN